jgi:hypothetical protein
MSAAGKHGTRWSAAEVGQLEAMVIQQIDLTEIAFRLRRTEKAVQAKLWGLRLRRPDGRGLKRKQRREKGASFFLS